MKFEWEEIDEENSSDNISQCTYRAKVSDCWVLRVGMPLDDEGDELSNLTIDGVSVALGDRILVKDQTISKT